VEKKRGGWGRPSGYDSSNIEIVDAPSILVDEGKLDNIKLQ